MTFLKEKNKLQQLDEKKMATAIEATFSALDELSRFFSNLKEN